MKLRMNQISLIIFLLTLLLRILPGPRTIDDAYITFRYARNILDGQGMVYNPGDIVLGTTTPLYTGLMTILGSLAGGADAPFPWIALLVNAFSDALSCMLLIRLGISLGSKNSGVACALIWAIAPMSVTFAIGGMETSVFILLMLATFYFYSAGRPVPAALAASMSLLTRPDALLFLLPLAIERVRRILPSQRLNPNPLPISSAELLTFFIPTLIWTAFSTIYFGSPLPHSITAKVAAYRLPPEAALIRLLQHYATPFLGHLTFGNLWIRIGLIIFPILFGLGTLLAIRKKPGSWVMFVYPWFYLTAFSIANPLIFRWYLAPPLPLYFLGILLGGERIAQDVKRPSLSLVFVVVAFMLTLNGWTLKPDHGPTRPAPKMAFIELELIYEAIGRNLEGKISSSEILSAGDIGALGYFSKAKILDTVGLISPEVAHYYPLPESFYEIIYAIAPDLILDEKPDYLVILEIYGRKGLLKEADFQNSYRLMEIIPTDLYGSDGMHIYIRDERG